MDSSYEESPRGDSNIKDFATKRSQQIVNMSTVLASTMSKQNPNLRSTHITGRPLYKDNSDVDDSDDENVTTAQGHTSYSIDPTNLNTAHKFQNQKNNHATNSTVITSSTVSKKHADKNHRRISQESNCSNYQARVGTNYMMHQTNDDQNRDWLPKTDYHKTDRIKLPGIRDFNNRNQDIIDGYQSGYLTGLEARQKPETDYDYKKDVGASFEQQKISNLS